MNESKWISVKDRLPNGENETRVLAVVESEFGYYYVDVLDYEKGKWWEFDSAFGDQGKVLYWWPFPEVPTELLQGRR